MPTPQPTPSLTPRQRRLNADFESVRAEFTGHPNIFVEPIGLHPPERYRITYRLEALALEGDQPVRINEVVVDMRFPLEYPSHEPFVKPVTSVFHPNVDKAQYCIGDYWAAGQPLVDIIRKIGDMLQLRVYNIRSPRNGDAATWVRLNEGLLPIGDVDLGTAELEIEIRPTTTPPSIPSAPFTAPRQDDGDEPRTRLEISL